MTVFFGNPGLEMGVLTPKTGLSLLDKWQLKSLMDINLMTHTTFLLSFKFDSDMGAAEK